MMDGISDVDIVGAEPLARRPVQVRLNTFENRGPDVVSRGMPRIQRIEGSASQFAGLESPISQMGKFFEPESLFIARLPCSLGG